MVGLIGNGFEGQNFLKVGKLQDHQDKFYIKYPQKELLNR